MTKLREKQILKRKQDVLDITMKLLVEHGYNNLNMDEIAEKAEISKPTLYQYFNSKDELVAQALVQMFERMQNRLTEHLDKPPIERMERFLRAMLKARHDTQASMGMGDMEIMRSILKRYPNTIDRLMEARAKLGEVVQQAQAQGEVDPNVPWWVIVNMMFSFIGATSTRFGKGELPRTPEELEQVNESIVRMFLRAIRVDQPVAPISSS